MWFSKSELTAIHGALMLSERHWTDFTVFLSRNHAETVKDVLERLQSSEQERLISRIDSVLHPDYGDKVVPMWRVQESDLVAMHEAGCFVLGRWPEYVDLIHDPATRYPTPATVVDAFGRFNEREARLIGRITWCWHGLFRRPEAS